MALSNDLINQFVKVTKSPDKKSSKSTVNGTVIVLDETVYVRFDGSELLTPVSKVADVEDGERVSVDIENHKATITGNATSPAARFDSVTDLSGLIGTEEEIENLKASELTVSGKLSAAEGIIGQLEVDNLAVNDKLIATEAEIDALKAADVTIDGKLTATNVAITNLQSDTATFKNATIDRLDANEADIYELNATYGNFVKLTTDNFAATNAVITNLQVNKLEADSAVITELQAKNATIENLVAKKADIDHLHADYATIDQLEVVDAKIENADITNLDAKYADIDFAEIKTANIYNLFTKMAMMDKVIMNETTVTGAVVAVTFKGDVIAANTLYADRLIIKNSEDGLYYQLNLNALGEPYVSSLTAEEQDGLKNGIHGSNIIANTITATHIYCTDLATFSAFIGGFALDYDAIRSVNKDSVHNSTEGIYLGSDGQMAIGGDGKNQIKYYLDPTDNQWKVLIHASTITLGTDNKDVEGSLNDSLTNASEANDKVDTLNEQINGENGAVIRIDGLEGQIITTATDEDGTTKLVQTGSGWSFNLGSLEARVNTNKADTDTALDKTNSNVSNLEKSLEEINKPLSYIHLDDKSGTPHLILGSNDPDESQFKVQITNQAIEFKDGESTPASISNQALNIDKAVIKNDLHIVGGEQGSYVGGFVWKVRENGNLGLSWTGGNY